LIEVGHDWGVHASGDFTACARALKQAMME
jgi:hypothetical protein